MKVYDHTTCSTPIRHVYNFPDTITDSDKKLRSLVPSVLEETVVRPSSIPQNFASYFGLDAIGNREPSSFYGLSTRVCELLAEQRGITSLYDWQKECLNMTSVSNGTNLVYSLPTSGGKTLVAEILMLQELLLREKNVLFILPFVSIVQEKVRSLTSMGLELGFWVEEYAGNRGRIPPIKRQGSHSVLIATIEKAHSIVNALIDSKSLSDIGLAIVDELHMIGEGGSRGACLEMTLTKLRLVSPKTRIIGMSATLANMSDLTRFLNAELYTSTFRPVKLVQYVKLGDHLFELDNPDQTGRDLVESPKELFAGRLVHRRMVHFQYTKQMQARDPDHLVGLVAETLMGHSVLDVKSGRDTPQRRFSCLVFCPTKVHCENTARMLAELLPPSACFPSSAAQELVQRRADLLTNLRVDNIPDHESSNTDSVAQVGMCCPVLSVTVPRGVAYHHGGLTQEERSALEEAYSDGTLSVLCCTSTLAAGVNLPARRVIIRKPYIGSAFLSGTQYQQIIGRAGRAGLDSIGESVTILQPTDRINFVRMLESIPRIPVTSSASPTSLSGCATSVASLCTSCLLYENGKGMRQLLLSLIGLQIATTFRDVMSAVQLTLFAVQANTECGNLVEQVVRAELQTLINKDLLLVTLDGSFLERSPFRTMRGRLENVQFQVTSSLVPVLVTTVLSRFLHRLCL
ncbi:POLQ-like helicase [Paragonimus westermani]|uniref:POLQ-like helicase n=1 Tax=Paragonimus westermani TaxID=34504 RepID=A0A5J4NZI9_9TREM|nr:POLQ-like helicase [Paragonimus westermani]